MLRDKCWCQCPCPWAIERRIEGIMKMVGNIPRRFITDKRCRKEEKRMNRWKAKEMGSKMGDWCDISISPAHDSTCTRIKLCKLITVLRTAKVTKYKSGHGQWSTCRALAGNKVFNSRVQLSIGLIKAFRLKDWVPAKVLPATCWNNCALQKHK